MKYITLHWSAGSHKAGKLDRKHYHYCVEGDGTIKSGDFKPEDNEECTPGTYAAHTRGANTGNISVSLCAMHGAKERPFDPGKYPITEKQLDAAVALMADLVISHGIPVTRQNVLSHAEWEPTNGVKQRGKWDVSWIPGMDKPGDPVAVGDEIRARIKAAMAPPKPAKKPGLLATLIDLIASFFRKEKR